MLDKKNFYINGAWVKPNSSEEIKVIDPATEENCAVITLGNKADVDIAVNAAALTAISTSALFPKVITAQFSSVAGSITLISSELFGLTHAPLM